MRNNVGWAVIGLLVCAGVSGCGPSISDSDLGQKIYEVPAVAGADQPYQFPKIPPPVPGSEADLRLKLQIMRKSHLTQTPSPPSDASKGEAKVKPLTDVVGQKPADTTPKDVNTPPTPTK
jgi:hypothetical protein